METQRSAMLERGEAAPDEVSLQQYLDVLWRRRWTIVNTAVAVLVVGCIATALMTPIYQAESKLLVLATSPQVSTVNTEDPLADLLAMAQPESVDTQIEVLRSQPFIDEVLAAAHAPTDKRAPLVRVAGVKDTNVIDVKVESPDPRMASKVANRMLTHYLEHTTVLSLEEITRAREFVQKEELQAQRSLQDAEDALSEFRRKNRVAELTAEQQSRTQQFVDLEGKSRETRSDIARVQAEIRGVQAELARTSRDQVVSTGHENPRVDALQAKLAEATVERATLLKSYRPTHLKVRTVDATIANLRAQLAAEPAEVRVPLHVPNDRYAKLLDRLDGYQQDLDGLLAQQAAIEPQLALQRQRMDQLGPWEVRLGQLQRNRDMAEKTYVDLAGKLQDLQIRENARRSTARIIESAVAPRSPVRPRRAVNIAVSLILGLLLGGCMAFLLDVLDDRITSPEEVDRLVALPVLGHIPAIAGERHLISGLPSHSPACESYRGLRSSISFSAIDTPLKTLGVTSARAAEGKSTTAMNLALAMAMDGREIILVDTDMRRPSIHQMLGLPASPGLSDVLTGQCDLEDALQASPEHRMLILTSGPIPPNPAEMLNTAAMETVIQKLRGMADVVIFDTPPCLPVTDTQVLGAKLDGMLLVAQMGEARKAELRRARELLDQAHIRVLGVVLNKLRSQASAYYRYGYYRAEYSSNGHRNGSNGNGNGSGPAGPVRLPRLAGHRGGEAATEEEE